MINELREKQKEIYENDCKIVNDKINNLQLKTAKKENVFFKFILTIYSLIYAPIISKIYKIKNWKYKRFVNKQKRNTFTMAGESIYKVIVRKIIQAIFLIIMAFIIIFPFYWMFMTSFKSFDEINPSFKETLFPKHWTLEAYTKLFQYIDNTGAKQQISLSKFFINSFIVSTISTVCEIVVSLLAGFALYNWKTKLNRVFVIIMFSLIMLPGESLLMGRFIFAVKLGWKDNVLALIVPFIGNAFTIYLVSKSFDSIGKELKWASKVDGLSTFKFFIKIAIPAIMPIIATTAIISFIESWNSILWPVTIMKSDSTWSTIPMMLYGVINITGGDIDPTGSVTQNPTNIKMAACVISILPIVILFVIFNKMIVKNLSKRGVVGKKG